MTAITVGLEPIVRTSSSMTGASMIDRNSPANASGVLEVFEIWTPNNGSGLKMGTFYLNVYAWRYINRDYETIGNFSGGSKQTFTGKSCDVVAGDFIGAYHTDAGWYFQASGGIGYAQKAVDTFGAGLVTDYTLDEDGRVWIKGKGISVAPTTTTTSTTTTTTTTAPPPVDRSWVIFRDVAIPAAARIKAANALLTANGNRHYTRANVNVYFVASDTAPPAPVNSYFAHTLGPPTAMVPWSNIGPWIDGQEYATPDLKAALQEIIDRPGWMPGNDVMMIIEDNASDAGAVRSFSSIRHSGGAEKAALCVTFEEEA